MRYEAIERVFRESKVAEKLKQICGAEMHKKSVKVVMGNPSCDQDSFLGALVLGLALERLPVVNLPREVFKCKGDLVKLIEMVGVRIEELVFLEDLENELVLCRGSQLIYAKDINISAFLIDHNFPSRKLLECKTFHVDHIIDHHPILDMSPMYSTTRSLEIELDAGSCSSLIYRHIKYILEKEIRRRPENYRFLALLTVPVQTDTGLLTNRTHPVDQVAVEELLKMIDVSREESNSLCKMLKKEKACESRFESKLILRMDYKKFDYPGTAGEKTFGMSSVKYPFDDWIKRDGGNKFTREIAEFARKERHEFFVINSKSRGTREFYIYSAPGVGEDFAQKVIFNGGPVKKRNISSVSVYTADLLLSRKLFAPRVIAYLKEAS